MLVSSANQEFLADSRFAPESRIQGVVLRVRCDGCGKALGNGWYRHVMGGPDGRVVIALYHEGCRAKAERMARWRRHRAGSAGCRY